MVESNRAEDMGMAAVPHIGCSRHGCSIASYCRNDAGTNGRHALCTPAPGLRLCLRVLWYGCSEYM